MVATIKLNLSEAVVTYEEKPREQWIFDPPAQVLTLTISYTYSTYNHAYNYIYILLYSLASYTYSITMPISILSC